MAASPQNPPPTRHDDSYRLSQPAGFIGPSLVMAAAYTAAVHALAGLDRLNGWEPVEPVGRSLAWPDVASVLASGWVLGMVMGPVARRLPLRPAERRGVLLILIYLVKGLLANVQAFFYTTYPSGRLVGGLLFDLAVAALATELLVRLYPPHDATRRLWPELRAFLGLRDWRSWLWGVALAALLYFPVFVVFGALAAPFIWEQPGPADSGELPIDPAAPGELIVPPLPVAFGLETARGLLFILAVWPLLAMLEGGRWRLGFWLGLVLTTLGGVMPMLEAESYPLQTRLVSGLEISAISLVHGLIIASLLGLPRPKDRIPLPPSLP